MSVSVSWNASFTALDGCSALNTVTLERSRHAPVRNNPIYRRCPPNRNCVSERIRPVAEIRSQDDVIVVDVDDDVGGRRRRRTGGRRGGDVAGAGRRGAGPLRERLAADVVERRDVVHRATHASAGLASRWRRPARSQHAADSALAAGRVSARPRQGPLPRTLPVSTRHVDSDADTHLVAHLVSPH